MVCMKDGVRVVADEVERVLRTVGMEGSTQ